MDCNDADEVFLNGLDSENSVISLFCCGVLRSGVGGFCSTDCPETQLGGKAVSEMTFGLCRQIPVHFSTITFLVVAICIHPSQPPSFWGFFTCIFYMIHGYKYFFLFYILHVKARYDIEILTSIVTTKAKLYFNIYLPRYFKISVRPYLLNFKYRYYPQTTSLTSDYMQILMNKCK
jgi:hypothetical protein